MNIVVRTDNRAPILAPIGNQTLSEGVAFELALNAVDLDGDMITYEAANLPLGSSFDTQTGVFRWTPHLFQAGDYSVDFSVSDGNLGTTETVIFTVENVNQAPVLAYMPSQWTREGNTLAFNLVGGDPDSEPIVYSVVTPLPDGAFFDNTDSYFEWTPTYRSGQKWTPKMSQLLKCNS